jgi:hypothetical protein
MRRRDIIRNQEIMERNKTIVDGAPPEQDKREAYVSEYCLSLEEAGIHLAEIEDSVRSILRLARRHDTLNPETRPPSSKTVCRRISRALAQNAGGAAVFTWDEFFPGEIRRSNSRRAYGSVLTRVK